MGLQEARQSTHDLQFAPGRHTGILYTAPAASDHVAVSLLLRVEALGRPWSRAQSQRPDGGASGAKPDATTKACSFRPQRSLHSFFAPTAAKRPQQAEHKEGGAGAEREGHDESSKRPKA